MKPLFESSETERVFVIRSGDGRYVMHRRSIDACGLIAELTDGLDRASMYDNVDKAHKDRKTCGMADKWDLYVVQIEIEHKKIARLAQ